jgi:MFS family permease
MQNKSSLCSLLFTIFNDSIGWGIVLTIFAPLVFESTGIFLPANTSETVRNILLGLLIGSYAITQFVSMPLIGALSDHFGRKKILAWTLVGAMFSFFLSGIAVAVKSLALLFASRLLAGLFSGNSGTAQASIADMSTERTKAKNLSLSGVVGGFSWIIGPPIGGILSTPKWVPWFDFATPFWFLGVLFFINLIWILKSYVETREKKEKHDWKQEIKDLSKLSKIPRMSGWLAITFLFFLGWFFFGLYYPTLLVLKFNFNQEDIGYISGYMSLFWVAGSFLLNRGLAEKMSPERYVLWSLPIAATLIVITAFLPSISWWFLTLPIMTLCGSSCWINTMAAASNLAGKENQGKVFGIVQSLLSLALFLAPLCSGVLAARESSLSLLIGAAILFCTFCFAAGMTRKKA